MKCKYYCYLERDSISNVCILHLNSLTNQRVIYHLDNIRYAASFSSMRNWDMTQKRVNQRYSSIMLLEVMLTHAKCFLLVFIRSLRTLYSLRALELLLTISVVPKILRKPEYSLSLSLS